jgi:translocation and assembly module TamB
LALTGGRYLNFAAGTELRDLNLEVAGDGRRFALRRLDAKDAANGTLRAQGTLDLVGTAGPAVDLSVTLDSFQAVRRDEFTATADGELRLAGAADAATLSGRLEIDRAEIRIPERLPPHVARFDVIEINSQSNVVL